MIEVLRPCRQPLCPTLVPYGYCKEHQHPVIVNRPNSNDRGYDYRHQCFRKRYLAKYPMCHDCEIRPAKDLHHVKKLREFPELRLVESNCLGLCHVCHSIRTARGE